MTRAQNAQTLRDCLAQCPELTRLVNAAEQNQQILAEMNRQRSAGRSPHFLDMATSDREYVASLDAVLSLRDAPVTGGTPI